MIELIAAYRNRGHLMADTDPLRLDKDRFRSPIPTSTCTPTA